MIRAYNDKDWASVADVYSNCFGPEFTLDLLERQMKKSKCFVFVHKNDMVVGYLLMAMKNGSPYVNQVAVHGWYRGAGIGSQLLDYAETVYEDKSIWLEVEANNPAQSLYFKHGYRVKAVLKDYNGPGRNGLVMSKILGTKRT